MFICALGTMQAIAGARHDTSNRTSTPNWRTYVTPGNYTLASSLFRPEHCSSSELIRIMILFKACDKKSKNANSSRDRSAENFNCALHVFLLLVRFFEWSPLLSERRQDSRGLWPHGVAMNSRLKQRLGARCPHRSCAWNQNGQWQ